MQVSYNEFVSNLANNLQNNDRLKKIITEFQKCYNLTPVIGVEIEFYLNPEIDITEFETLSCKYLAKQKISKIKKEKGNNQYEVDLPPTTDLINYIDEILNVKLILREIAEKLGGNINFSPKPFLNDYGNSMHFHMNFLSSNGLVTGERANNKIALVHELTNLAAKSLCHYMLDTLLVFMPDEEDYLRLDKNFMAPTNISFGNNNRSVALRIPSSVPKRLEYRLASPNTNPYIAIFTILKSILLGFQSPKNINDITKIYGNAFDEQYNLAPLPKSLKESFKLFKPKFFEED